MGFLKSLFGAKEAKFVEVAPFNARYEVPSGETMLEAAARAPSASKTSPVIRPDIGFLSFLTTWCTRFL